MAMKALIMNAQGKTDEAFGLAKEALTVDMKSHICWHVYGLLYRSIKNFEEAIKAYKFALKLDPDNNQIQRDLAILQIQMRDYQGHIQSRFTMLQARPKFRQVWTALAVAHHLAGDPAEAERVLTTYEETLKATPSRQDFENSEAVMYKNTLIAEQGDYSRALEHLETAVKHNLDRLGYLEGRAEYLAKLERNEEAATAYRTLIERNPEHPEYYEGLIDAAKRLPLDFLEGNGFADAARAYLTFMLDKGIPSTFANLKHLYSDSSKKDTLLKLVSEYTEAAAKDEAKSEEKKDESKGETAGLYYLAQHYNYHLSRDLTKALEYIDRAIERIPDSVDFHMTKARIYKHTGDLVKAAEVMDKARSLDTKDRYINTKAAKYQLRNDENEKALKTMGMFTRADTPGGPISDLLDMQCMWFLTEDGEAFARRGETAMALKRFHQIFNIFEVWHDDQFDFHSFYLRKGQVRAYVDMIRWEDRVYEHPFYTRAALDAVEVYLKMHDKPSANGINGGDGADGDGDSERKKAARKARKEQQRLEREIAEQAAKRDPNKAKPAAGDTKKVDEDPHGLKLAATTEPLKEATKFLAPSCKKYLLALQCLNSAIALDQSNPKVHERIVEFRHVVKPELATLPAKVAEVIKSSYPAIEEAADLAKVNGEFLAGNKGSPAHILSGVRTQKVLGSADKAACEKQLLDLVKMDATTPDIAEEALETLKAWKSGEATAFKKAAAAKWPQVSRFA
ncbi:unnamed protein product [Parascedosporium putredinis]|uniref:NMDA receptor-regulated protein 1 n=1 Tax=Parascedosporium putredinis TaxID=1442378 RepID=A0A9P1M6D5_9PEZI|nr:unnamed protein product [Parascedosporium putredinis]CAI7989511.1 unnamed protein product [Parascedosporium putredinis]